MVENLVLLKENFMKQIHGARLEIAELTEEKINARAKAWLDAEGSAKQKEDYTRSQVSDYDYKIAVLNADIELYYNQLQILDEKIELEYLKDE